MFENVNGSSLRGFSRLTPLQTSTSRIPTFDRPSALRATLTSNYDIGKTAWSNDRSIWNGGSTIPERTNQGETGRRVQTQQSQDLQTDYVRAHVLRQSSTSSVKFGKVSNNVPLSPIDNPRNSSWAVLSTRPGETRYRYNLASPTNQNQSSWLFRDHLDHDVENSSLLAGSAPEIDYLDDSTSRDRPSARTFHTSVDKADRNSFFETNNAAPSLSNSRRFPGNDNQVTYPNTNTKLVTSSISGPYSGYSSTKPPDLVSAASTNPSPTARGFGRGSALRNGGSTISPTQSRFSKHSSLDPYLNGNGLTPKTPTENLPHSVTAPAREQKTLRINYEQSVPGHGYDLAHFSNGLLGSSLYDSVQSQPYPGDLIGTGAAPSFEPTHSHSQSGHYASMWSYGEHEMQSVPSSDYKHALSSPYYSTTGTPPTGPESIRSAGGSGISSRTSHHDINLVDRKLRNLDLYQPYQHNQSNGLIPVAPMGYDLSMHHSSMRMNPLAAPYNVVNNGSYGYGYPPNLRMPPREQPQVQVMRSPLLEEFRMGNKTNKRYELRDIFNHVVEFSGDQVGSRFIQQKLETANSDEKEQIFKEIQPNSLQLMTDIYGNYVIQKLFEYGNQSQKKMLANHMKGHVLTLSTQSFGCRVVQKALEHVLTDQQASMVKELDGPNKQVIMVIKDQNGNHVVQKAIERVPAEHIQFIVEAHKGEVVKLATHTYGCRVIQRILEHCEPSAKRVILDELHGCVGPLITDSFGNYVVQHVIVNGEPDDRRRVVSIVQHQLLIFSKHKFASNVVEKCVEYAEDDQRGRLFAN